MSRKMVWTEYRMPLKGIIRTPVFVHDVVSAKNGLIEKSN
jgi:hypothetical protein